ncbi:MAG: PAS domain S-box protein [Candidatus Cryosericum sp.]
MNILDIRTILIGFLANYVICTLVIASLWLQHYRHSPGLGLWTAGFALETLSVLLITLRGFVPDIVSIVVGNGLNVLGAILVFIGLEQYLDRRGPQLQNWVVLAVFAVVQTYFGLLHPTLTVLTINLSVALLFICGQCAWLMLRRTDARIRMATKPAGLVFAAYALVGVIRVPLTLLVPSSGDFLHSGPAEAIVLLVYQILFIALTFSLLLMLSRRLSIVLEDDIVRREHLEEELRHSEEKFSLAFHNIPDAILLTTAEDGTIIDVNESFSRITGYSREEAVGKTSVDIFLWNNQETRRNRLTEPLKSQDHIQHIEMEFPKKSGEVFTGWLSSQALRTPRGMWVLNILHDLTDQRKLEQEIDRERNQLQAVFDSVPGILYLYDDQERLILWNKKHEQLTGYSAEELSQMHLTDWYKGDEQSLSAITEGVRKTLTNGYGEAEALLQRKDGTTVPMYLTAVRLVIEGRHYFTGIGLDVTDRTRLQQELAHMASFPVQNPSPVIEIALDGSIRLANPASTAALVRLGLNPDARQFLPGTREELANLLLRCKRAPVTDELPLGTATFLRSVTTSPGEDTLRVYAVDITEQKRAESERQAMQRRLLQSQKMEAIGQLAGGVAHDFNNLLTGILGNIALVHSGLPSADPLRENLNAAETAAQNAADLTRGLLTFSRSAMVLPVPLRADTTIGEIADLLRQSLPATIEIVRDFQPNVWNILADRSQVTQILLNLAVNARDAMQGEGKITLTVRNEVIDLDYVQQHPEARLGEYVHVGVRDNGPGISDEIMRHLFEPFHTTKPSGSGTGLGLSIVYGAVKQANGWVTAASVPGTGTTFDIFLPRCLSAATGTEIPARGVDETCNGTILVVEDEPVVATVAQSFLTRSGCDVLLANNGAQALEAFDMHHEDIDLILLDMTMPGLTTDTIVHALRRRDPDVPILLNSGYTSSDMVKSLLDEGLVQGFLAKPYDLPQLLQTVHDLLAGSR